MDIAVCREVFTHLIAASEILGIGKRKHPALESDSRKVAAVSTGFRWRAEGVGVASIQEALDHRHVSHLYGVWPSDEITPDGTPELARAAWLAARKRGQGNASAHGLLHRSLAAARLKDPYLVNFDLKQLLEQGYVNPSLTTMHNPYALPSPDPQGGIPTLIMEMLVYSRPGVIGAASRCTGFTYEREYQGHPGADSDNRRPINLEPGNWQNRPDTHFED